VSFGLQPAPDASPDSIPRSGVETIVEVEVMTRRPYSLQMKRRWFESGFGALRGVPGSLCAAVRAAAITDVMHTSLVSFIRCPLSGHGGQTGSW
jgi:hypothetical protein